MSETVHPVPESFNGRFGPAEVEALYTLADSDPQRFWLEPAKRLDWQQFPQQTGDWSFDEDDFHVRWYADGKLNLSVNCLDRHLEKHGDRKAIIFEADEPGEGRTSICQVAGDFDVVISGCAAVVDDRASERRLLAHDAC